MGQFIVVSSWEDGDVVYHRRAGGGVTTGTRDRAEATRFSLTEAEEVQQGMLGGLPEFVGDTVDVEPAADPFEA